MLEDASEYCLVGSFERPKCLVQVMPHAIERAGHQVRPARLRRHDESVGMQAGLVGDWSSALLSSLSGGEVLVRQSGASSLETVGGVLKQQDAQYIPLAVRAEASPAARNFHRRMQATLKLGSGGLPRGTGFLPLAHDVQCAVKHAKIGQPVEYGSRLVGRQGAGGLENVPFTRVDPVP